MYQKTRNDFAAYGLEILKRSVLLVLYDAKQESAAPKRLKAGEIRQRLNLPYNQSPSGNVNALTQGVLDDLKRNGLASHAVRDGWRITEKGVSLIEDG